MSDDLKELLFTFEGRVNRAKWWGVGFFTWLYINIAWGVAYLAESGLVWFAVSMLYIAFVLANLAVSIRRWHDRGRSGWFYLVVFIPVIGTIWTLIELGLLAGDEDTNRYGPNPLDGS